MKVTGYIPAFFHTVEVYMANVLDFLLIPPLQKKKFPQCVSMMVVISAVFFLIFSVTQYCKLHSQQNNFCCDLRLTKSRFFTFK